jgi:hypothetical protein
MLPPTKKEILEARRVLLLSEQDEKSVKKKKTRNLGKTTKKIALRVLARRKRRSVPLLCSTELFSRVSRVY